MVEKGMESFCVIKYQYVDCIFPNVDVFKKYHSDPVSSAPLHLQEPFHSTWMNSLILFYYASDRKKFKNKIQ